MTFGPTRYDTDLCGTLDALEMEELQEDLLKRLKNAQKLARQVDAISLVPEDPYETWNDEGIQEEAPQAANHEVNPLNHNQVGVAIEMKSDM